jgi:hypothetical protein
MASSQSLSPAEAQDLVEGIADSYGWLPETERELTRPRALKAISNLQGVLGAAARTSVLMDQSFVSV